MKRPIQLFILTLFATIGLSTSATPEKAIENATQHSMQNLSGIEGKISALERKLEIIERKLDKLENNIDGNTADIIYKLRDIESAVKDLR